MKKLFLLVIILLLSACSVKENKNEEVKIEVQGGDFDLRKYQVARSQFFDRSNIVSMTFSINNIIFSTECIKKMPKNIPKYSYFLRAFCPKIDTFSDFWMNKKISCFLKNDKAKKWIL